MGRLSFEMSDGSKWIRVSNTDYEVLEQLSSIERGRYLVWDRNPRPRGTKYVALFLDKGIASNQLFDAIRSIPMGINGIPKLKNHGSLDKKLVLIIDYLPGMTLDEFIRKARIDNHEESRISVYEAIRLVRGLTHGVRFLHEELGLVHGDIKPENIVLSGKPWRLQLIDFGTCWRMSHLRDRVEGDGCSPHFAAPEMHLDGLIDHRADHFSLGVVLYLLLVGTLPYSGVATNLLGSPEVANSLKLPSKFSKEMGKMPLALRKQIDHLVQKMLRVNPNDRFPTTKLLVNELDSIWNDLRSVNIASNVSTKPFSMLDYLPTSWKTFIRAFLAKD